MLAVLRSARAGGGRQAVAHGTVTNCRSHTACAHQRAAPGLPPVPAPTLAACAGLVHLLILLAVLLFGLLSNRGPAYSLQPDRQFSDQLHTNQRGVPYYVRNAANFEASYPTYSPNRRQVEFQVRLGPARYMRVLT